MKCGKAAKLQERCILFDWNNGEIIGLKKMSATLQNLEAIYLLYNLKH
jgi:hypothetical protein